jgi:hypothetical protein
MLKELLNWNNCLKNLHLSKFKLIELVKRDVDCEQDKQSVSVVLAQKKFCYFHDLYNQTKLRQWFRFSLHPSIIQK